ncbi:MAG: SPFH domain-containing protein [Candidatus Nanopelagicales bacterium]|nr:SPFH domain-containing protein [Candidatus Nanopelagicales bacterium]
MNWFTTLFSTMGKPFLWWVVIAPWERGVRIRLGRTARLLEPGLHFRIPGVDRIYAQSIRLRTLWSCNQTVTTRDRRTVTISIAVNFRIADLLEVYNSLSTPDVTIRAAALGLAMDCISQRDRDQVTPGAVAQHINEGLKGWGCGLADLSARITTFVEGRAIRLLSHEYETGSGLGDFEPGETRGTR